MRRNFFSKIVDKVNRLDPESLQEQFRRLEHEWSFLGRVLQTIQEAVLVLDDEGNLITANQAAEQIFNFDLARSEGRSFNRYLRDWGWTDLPDFARENDDWSRLLSREIEVSYPVHRLLSAYAVPIADEGDHKDDKGRGVLLIFRDVTRERQVEENLIESEKLNAINLLAAGVAHEIGNPLNALNIHLQLLSREISGLADKHAAEDLGGLVDTARSEVARLHSIITQFLQAVRPSKPVMHPGDLADVLQETLRVLKSEIENRRIQISVEMAEKIPIVAIDRGQINQAFFNLIKNAMEAIQDGGTLRMVFAVDDVWVTFSLFDNGCGISEENLGRIFEPYHTTKPDGTGLGLMIVRRIIQEHGGEIEVLSKVNAGSCFRIRLPRHERIIRKLA